MSGQKLPDGTHQATPSTGGGGALVVSHNGIRLTDAMGQVFYWNEQLRSYIINADADWIVRFLGTPPSSWISILTLGSEEFTTTGTVTLGT